MVGWSIVMGGIMLIGVSGNNARGATSSTGSSNGRLSSEGERLHHGDQIPWKAAKHWTAP
jgi:hypothetical protein